MAAEKKAALAQARKVEAAKKRAAILEAKRIAAEERKALTVAKKRKSSCQKGQQMLVQWRKHKLLLRKQRKTNLFVFMNFFE